MTRHRQASRETEGLERFGIMPTELPLGTKTFPVRETGRIDWCRIYVGMLSGHRWGRITNHENRVLGSPRRNSLNTCALKKIITATDQRKSAYYVAWAGPVRDTALFIFLLEMLARVEAGAEQRVGKEQWGQEGSREDDCYLSPPVMPTPSWTELSNGRHRL